MRLLFVCQDLDSGGAQRAWADLIAGLAARQHEPRLLTLGAGGALFEELRSRGLPAEQASMRRRLDPRGLKALRAPRPHPDVVLAQQASGQVAGMALAGRARVPLVVTEHTPCTADGRLVPARRHQRVLLRLAARRAARTVAVAAAQVEPLVRAGHARDRIKVIPNGVVAERVRPTRRREEVRAALGLAPADFAVLQLAGLRPEKRVDLFAEAIALARREEPRVRGLVGGEGRERLALQRLADDGLTLLGHRDDVPDLLAAADCLCLSSDAEALPLSALEAMAAARPVVATDVGGSAEAVADGQTGLVTPPGDGAALARALLRLAGDPEEASRMGERGRERQRALFDADAMVDAYARELEEVAGS